MDRSSLSVLTPLAVLSEISDVRDCLSVAPERILVSSSARLDDFALVHLLGLLDAQTNGAPEVLHENLSLLHLRAVHLGANHGAEGHLRAQLLCNGKGKRCFSGSRGARKQQRTAGHLSGLDEVGYNSCRLTSLLLANEARCDRNRYRPAR